MATSADMKDDYEDREPRTVKMTERGDEYYHSQKDLLFKKVRSSSVILDDCLVNLQTLPKSLISLENAESNLQMVFKRYNSCANEYLDFLSRSRVSESDQELEKYWPVFKGYEKDFNTMIDNIHVAIDSCEVRTERSSRSHKSVKTEKSHASSRHSLSARAKAESERVKLQFVHKEIQLKKEQFDKTMQLQALEQQKLAAAADAEASYLEKQSQVGSVLGEKVDLPKEEITSFEKTMFYLDGLSNQEVKSLSAHVPPFLPSKNVQIENVTQSTPAAHISYESKLPTMTNKTTVPQFSSMCTMQPDISVKPIQSIPSDTSNFLIKKNLMLESFQQQRFDDKPDRYIVWKTQFKVMVTDIKCSALEEIALITNCLAKDSDAHRLVMSTRASCASNPEQCLHTIWCRMDERFGSAELLESTLKSRLLNIPDFTDHKKLYDLHDLLTEIQAVKNLNEYSVIFSYLDSSIGIKPIVQKLPRYLQEKWVTRVVNYKKQYQVIFPPFSEFVKFIGDMSIIRNDPGLVYDAPRAPPSVRRRQGSNRAIVSCKTDAVTPVTQRISKQICLIHKDSKHSINECRAFRSKSIDDRKGLLKKHNICLRCCESSGHFANRCKYTIVCDICKRNSHCTAMHNDTRPSFTHVSKLHQTDNSSSQHGEEAEVLSGNQISVKTNCTEICNGFTGRSCSKILPVRVFREGQPDKIMHVYAMLDDQSNKTLGKSEIFDLLNDRAPEIEYTMESCSGKIDTSGRIAEGLVVEGLYDNIQLKLPSVLECDNIPDNRSEIPTPDIAYHYPHMQDIARNLHDYDPSMKILLLIGRDLPEAHHVLEQRTGPLRSPFAQGLALGWTIIGDTCLSGQHRPSFNGVGKTFVTESGRPTSFEPCKQKLNIRTNFVTTNKLQVTSVNIFETTKDDNKPGLSIEDHKFLGIMDREFQLGSEGKWVAPLPFRSPRKPIPDNYQLALNRAKSLDASLHRDEKKKDHFLTFMQKVFDNNHAELAPYLSPGRERWYLPLFGVYHPRKPDQIRGVFDSSAQYDGISLNDQLLQGPDLINNLIGILIRFRKEMVAVVADIQHMFHSFLVREDHRDFLRFLWHKDNILENPLVVYRMRVHVFGNLPSPSIAMYGLGRIADLAVKSHGQEVSDFISDDFYVDDGLKSLPSSDDAIDLIRKTQDAMKMHGDLRLHKFASNSKADMDAFETEDLAKDLVDLDFEKDIMTQRSLGLLWDLRTDTFKFSISSNIKPATRRGILSVVNSLYDPLGFISPVTIRGKIILRKIVSSSFDWDDPLPDDLLDEWDRWRSYLPELEDLRIPRVIVPNLSETQHRELLVYCDASELAIAAVCYLKVDYFDGSTSTGYVLGKAKVAPLRSHTIPRIELCAAVLAIEIAQVAGEHLKMELQDVKFFSDSRVVLGYISNDKKRFYTYVANRVARIRNYSNPSQWSYIRSEINPADVGTRGVYPSEMSNSIWLKGPNMNEQSSSDTSKVEDDSMPIYPLVNPDKDNEIQSNKIYVEQKSGLDNILSRFSDWDRLVRALANIRRYIQRHRSNQSDSSQMNDVDLLRSTEQIIIKDAQRSVYGSEIDCLLASEPLHKSSSIYKLDPYVDSDGLLRVGGRLKHLKTDMCFKNPIILPAKHHVSSLIAHRYHLEVKHQGRHITEGRIRSSGYWIVGGKKLVASLLHKCVTCRKLRKELSCQKMANLPEDRVEFGQPPFSNVGVDIFGPWEVVTRRTRGGSANSKRWAALFTCLVTRAVHIEVVEEMTASSFINALRRFIAIRGNVKIFRSDRGTNFVGAVGELKLDSISVEDGPIHNFLNKCCTKWIFNPPHSSHMGGVWERMIGIARRILDAMLLEYGSRTLTHEVLSTFLTEVSSIINSRPLIAVSTDPEDPFILSPSTLLTQKTNVIDYDFLDCDHIDRKDLLRKQWKRVQNLASTFASTFWKRWKADYLSMLQSRQKWNSPQRNVTIGDIVLIRDKELSRNCWPMGIVTEAIHGDDGFIRKAVIRVIKNGEPKTFVRPIHELVFLIE